VAKVNAGGGGVGYLTYIGSEANILNAIAVDATGNVYLGGQSAMTGAAFAILAKLNPTGSAMLWASSLVGIVQSIAVDASGSVWATGTTASSTFPNANGWTTGPEFLVGLNAAGSELTYSALFPTGTVAQSVAVDSSGFVHTAGYNGFVSAVNPTSARAMEVFALQNGFGENLTARIAPAEVITIWGPGIGPATPATATPAMPRSASCDQPWLLAPRVADDDGPPQLKRGSSTGGSTPSTNSDATCRVCCPIETPTSLMRAGFRPDVGSRAAVE